MKNILSFGLIVLIAALTTGFKKPALNSQLPAKISEGPTQGKIDITEKRNKAVARRFYDDVVNTHNLSMIDSFASPNYIEHQYDTHFAGNLKGMKTAFSHYFTAFPDMHVKVNFMTVEGDLVTSQITTTGTNTGPIYGMPATNRKIEINGVDIVRIKDGKAVEHWGYAEEGKMLTQLGLIRPLLREGRQEARKQKKIAGTNVSSSD